LGYECTQSQVRYYDDGSVIESATRATDLTSICVSKMFEKSSAYCSRLEPKRKKGY
jgi:hypothetical protein